jgi:hypothetical protein
MEPVTRKIKILKAEYVKDAESIAILGECSEGQVKTQINKSSFSFGARTTAEIDYEMEKTAHLMVGKEINLVFDAELENKIDCGQGLNYR